MVKYHTVTMIITYFTGLVTDTVGTFGLMPNLTVICEGDVAHLNFSAGGNRVISLRAAQECTVLSTNETILDQEVHSNNYTAHDQKLMNYTYVADSSVIML